MPQIAPFPFNPIQLRDGSTTTDARLNRLVRFDERSRAYNVADILPSDLKSKTWGVPGDNLDQGHEGACVGAGVTHELKAYPSAVEGLDMKFAVEQIYWPAQRNDPWPGGSYPGASPHYEGTAVIDGVKVAQKLGYYDSYHWAFNVIDIARAIAHLGPVIVGTEWRTGMDSPDERGWITADGDVRGGHCYLLTGVSGIVDGPPRFRVRNSWGEDWGHAGDAFIAFEEFAKLMAADGEAVIPTGRHKTA